MASQVNSGTFCFLLISAAEEPRSQAFTLVKQDELSLKVRFIQSGQLWWFFWSCFPTQRVSASGCWGRPMVSRYPGIPEQLSRMAHGWSDRHAGGEGSNICILKHCLEKMTDHEGHTRSCRSCPRKELTEATIWTEAGNRHCKTLLQKHLRHPWLKLRISGWAKRTLETLAVCEFPCLAKRPVRATKKGRNWWFLSVKFSHALNSCENPAYNRYELVWLQRLGMIFGFHAINNHNLRLYCSHRSTHWASPAKEWTNLSGCSRFEPLGTVVGSFWLGHGGNVDGIYSIYRYRRVFMAGQPTPLTYALRNKGLIRPY